MNIYRAIQCIFRCCFVMAITVCTSFQVICSFQCFPERGAFCEYSVKLMSMNLLNLRCSFQQCVAFRPFESTENCLICTLIVLPVCPSVHKLDSSDCMEQCVPPMLCGLGSFYMRWSGGVCSKSRSDFFFSNWGLKKSGRGEEW